MKALFIFICVFNFFYNISEAQVGIGTNNPNTSSVLDITSTNKGFLPPRMTKVNRNSIQDKVAGLTIWCSDCGVKGEMQVFNGSDWTNMAGGAPADLQVDDLYGGGFVVYILQPGDTNYIAGQIHGFIAAPVDQSDDVPWGCHGVNLSGTFTSLGRGQTNTIRIVNSCSPALNAAKICDQLDLNGYSDWYLPSKDELLKLLYKPYLNISGILPYWTSSQSTSSAAWAIGFPNGAEFAVSKASGYNVRAIRSF